MRTSTTHVGELAVPLPLTYWDRPWAKAHIYTDCPEFSKEWAGKDFHLPRRADRIRQASRHTSGLCTRCWFAYNVQVRSGRA